MKYKAVLSCKCGHKELISDGDYESILKGERGISSKCGHWYPSLSIRARHKVNYKDWRFVHGSAK
jgi:hypothetical protein